MQNYLILHIDLSKHSSRTEELPGTIVRSYLGGRGLGSYLLARSVPSGIDPLSDNNHIIFTAGPASGTGLFYSAKTVVTTKSPLTGIYMYAVSSGLFAHQLRKAGFWAVDIYGKSEKPVYLSITNDSITFKDASHIWGMETAEAQLVMSAAEPRTKVAVVGIGPAGEKLIPMAAVMAEGQYYRAFGRCGAGAVMGSKRLKGVTVSGSKDVPIGNPEGFNLAQKTMLSNIKSAQKWVESRRKHGTGADLEELSSFGILPTRNWQSGVFNGATTLSTSNVNYPRKDISCGAYCPTICAHYTEIDDGLYRGSSCDGPEYETIYAFGSNCGINKFDAVVAAAQICDEHGIDTMSAGCTIAFAMECFENNLLTLKDTEGIDLRFGKDDAMLLALKKLVDFEGFGKRLALGTRKLSSQIPGSEAFAMESKGLEFGGYECRGLTGQSLQYAVSTRGGCHHAFGLVARAEVANGTRLQVEGKGAQVIKAATQRVLRDSLAACTFPGQILTDSLMPAIYSALYGEKIDDEELSIAALRIMTQERIINMREGLTRADDTLPARLLNEPKVDGPTKGVVVPLESLKDDFYRKIGWDIVTGNPSKDFIRNLGVIG